MTRYSYVNGSVVPHDEAVVSIEDRGYQFADGVYEVVLVKNGSIIDWDAHYQRLQHSLAGLRIEDHHSSKEWLSIITDLLQRHQLKDAFVYLQVSRGVAPRNHGFPKDAAETACVVTVSPLKTLPEASYDKGVKLKTCPDLRWKRRDFKTIALLPNVLAKQEATEAGAEEALLIEDNGEVTEGSASNFFWVDKEERLCTHPATERILHGITRKAVLALANESQVEVVEEAFPLEIIKSEAKEAFITSTTKLVLPVSHIDEKSLGGVGPVTQRLMQLYQDYVEGYGNKAA